MSTSLMSCVRENTPPLDSKDMQAEIATMSLPSEYSEPQKRRRFNALKNLRRIFRRRTVASAETLPSKGKIRSHITPVELEDGHFRDTFSAYKQPSLVSIRSTTTTNEERNYDCGGGSRTRSTTLDYGHSGSGSGGGGLSRGHRSGQRRHVEDYSFDDCRRVRDPRYSHKLSSQVNPLDRISIHVNETISAASGDWTNGAHKRSYSEDRLKEGVPLDQEISKSHESVFREPGDMAMLTIGLKTELIDVLRKRRSRPDAFESTLEAALSPKRSSAEMYDLRNTLPNRKVVDPEAQVRLIGTDVPDLAPLSHGHLKMHLSSSSKDPEKNIPGPVLLSHSAARHKMAVRPKKKGPTRFRRSVESANANGLDLSASSDKSADEHREVPQGRKISIDLSSKSTSSSAFEAVSSEDPQSPPLVSIRAAAERPKSMVPLSNYMDRHLGSSNSPPKSSSSYLESLKASYRHSPSNITKSEEHLQDTGRDSVKLGYNVHDLSYNKPTLPPAAAAASPCLSKISGGRRRSVEKSQSFKVFSNNPPPHSPLENVSDRRELFHLNRPVSYKEFSKPQITPRTDLRSLLDSSPGKQPLTENVLPTVKTNNIIQIEENIDKLVSSPFVPSLLKKVTSSPEEKQKSNHNVSITTIRPPIVDLVSSDSSNEKSSSSEDSSPIKSPSVNLRRRSSSSKMEKSPSVGSLNTLGTSEESKVPEFMRIHLNRVENTRPKSSIVLYKGTSDTLPRRFSRELDATKPPLPPVLNTSTLKRPSINKSQETITESNHVIIVPVISPRKASIDSLPPPLATNTVAHPAKVPTSPMAVEPKSPSVPVTKSGEVVMERKGSVSEEKAKIERRLSIADEKNIIRKKSIPTSSNGVNGTKGSNKEDNTPELMKVFARRSMKLKDDDDEPIPVVQKSDSRSSMVTDSDKENQSSSREELSPKGKMEEDMPTVNNNKEGKSRTGDAPYRPRTFLEVKHMLQSTNGNAVVSNNHKSISNGARTQKMGSIVPATTGDTVKKDPPSPPAIQKSPRNNIVSEVLPSPVLLISEDDKLPEFKRIVERREEWESRAKMWK